MTNNSPRLQFLLALLLATLVGVGLFLFQAIHNDSLAYDYLLWNLFLAWLPLLFALWLVRILKTKLWSSWPALGISVLWLIFLPNSFYMISDFIHLQEVSRSDVLYDALMFSSIIYTGVFIGFTSLYLVHQQLKHRFSDAVSASYIALTILLCSAAVYIGRDLRWNSWDIVTNPGGLLFDVSERLQHPADYPQMLITITTFFVLLSSMYLLIMRSVQLLRRS